MTICVFGGYDGDHPRNRVIQKSLKAAFIDVRECHDRMPNRTLRVLRLALRFRQLQDGVDTILVGASGHLYVPIAWLLGKIYSKTVVLDAFISYHECYCDDQRVSWLTRLVGLAIDWMAVRMSDLVLIDTNEHVDYLTRLVGASRSHVRAIPVGSDVGSRLGKKIQDSPFRVIFVGSFLPHHGIDTISEAAILLRDEQNLLIEMIGDAKASQYLKSRYPDTPIRFHDPMTYDQYSAYLGQSDIALGIFGTTPKAKRVIPCKVYDALAAGVPVITADVPAVRGLLRHGENAWLVPAGDARALASAVRALSGDVSLRIRLAMGGKSTFQHHCAPEQIGHSLRRMLEPLVRRDNSQAQLADA